MIIIKPVQGPIYDPAHRDFLPAEGRQFSALTSYWIRRQKEGGIVVLKERQGTATKKSTTKKSKEND